MIKIAHIIHPVTVSETSDLRIAQLITFETMKIARDFAIHTPHIEIDLFAVQFQDEARIRLPDCFKRIPDISRSVSDNISFKKKRKLALMKDILDCLYRNSSADYMIYTNVDIALQPHFYIVVSKIIEQGCDAFIINRRTIPGYYTTIAEIPLMYAETGEKHKGWDCFVFAREYYSRFDLGNSCIGTGWIGRVMITNMAAFAKNFNIFQDMHLTFHIGNEKIWQAPEYDDYIQHNKTECHRILTAFDKKYGPFDREKFPGRFFRLFDQVEAQDAENGSPHPSRNSLENQ